MEEYIDQYAVEDWKGKNNTWASVKKGFDTREWVLKKYWKAW